jgi:hypothetical protein
LDPLLRSSPLVNFLFHQEKKRKEKKKKKKKKKTLCTSPTCISLLARKKKLEIISNESFLMRLLMVIHSMGPLISGFHFLSTPPPLYISFSLSPPVCGKLLMKGESLLLMKDQETETILSTPSG